MSSGLDLAALKAHCQVDFPDHDTLLAGFLASAEQHVVNHLRRDLDTDFGDGAWPEPVQTAILMLVAHFYRNREAVITGANVAVVPLAVSALLADYRVYS